MPESLLPLSPVHFLLLAVLADEELHGYGLVQEIERRTDGAVRLRPGNLYRQLDRLLDQGLVHDGGRRPVAGGPPRRYYRISAVGRKLAAEEVLLRYRLMASSAGLRKAVALLGEGEAT